MSVSTRIIGLKAAVLDGGSLPDALVAHVGGLEMAEGLWRFFSPNHPASGVTEWNEAWRTAWRVPAGSAFAFGEDLFGNQLLVTQSRPTMIVCDHENGMCHDVGVDVTDVLGAVAQHGLAWIDFYSSEALSVGRAFVPRPNWEEHLHWIQPLFLGGTPNAKNVTKVERLNHLHGHAKLWEQMAELPPGTEVRLRYSADQE